MFKLALYVAVVTIVSGAVLTSTKDEDLQQRIEKSFGQWLRVQKKEGIEIEVEHEGLMPSGSDLGLVLCVPKN